ncbi:hypothetical protein LCGC14_2376650, partial [marine sediment metagenome]
IISSGKKLSDYYYEKEIEKLQVVKKINV